MKYMYLLPFVFCAVCQAVYADTIVLKDGQELKGVIVEDYQDRVVISTENGETSVSKTGVDKISYDIPEVNLVKLATFYKDKGDYKAALYCYESARKLNPEMREAQEGSLLVTNMIVREKESDIAQDVAMRQDIEENMGPAQPSEQVESRQLREGADELWRSIGIAIETSGPSVIVTRVMTKSPAYTAGIKPQDEIISIWGKLVKYMPLTGVYDMFLSSKVSEIRLAIEREKRPALKKKFFFRSTEDMIGARLSMDLDGLTVAQVRPGGPFDNSNILKGDRITMLGGVSTRYMPLESACKMIEKVKDGSLEIGIQREVTVWRR